MEEQTSTGDDDQVLLKENAVKEPVVVGYVFSRDLLVLANQLPEVRGRALLVHQLIGAYGLLPSLKRIEPTAASDAELRHFHTAEYIDFVRQLETKMTENADEADEVSWSEDCEAFGLAYDCPPFQMIHRTISYLAGASLGAARALVEGRCSLAINWFGGWHHGRRDEGKREKLFSVDIFSILF